MQSCYDWTDQISCLAWCFEKILPFFKQNGEQWVHGRSLSSAQVTENKTFSEHRAQEQG